MKLALLGTGNISRFHIHALRAAGFSIVAAAASNQSKTVSKFCEEFDIPKVYLDPLEMLNSRHWEALLVAIPTVNILGYENYFLKETRPILLEKPGAHESASLHRFKSKSNIVVGYNRRHYDVVNYMAHNLRLAKDPILVKVSIPETYSVQLDVPGKFPYYVYENSTHVFDLLNFLFGEVEWRTATKKHEEFNKVNLLVAHGQATKFNAEIVLDMAFGYPQNFAIEVFLNQTRIVLSPLEVMTHFNGMEVIEPSVSIPIRQYKPRHAKILVEKTAEGQKPGFLKQSQEFFEFVKSSEVNNLATISDAIAALEAPETLWELSS